jgi:glutamyl-tRNA synthetase
MPLEGETAFYDEVYGEVVIENKTLEDQVLLKSDGLPTYNFANVIDDHLMNVTHILRGKEYITSTPKYKLLYEALGWEMPKIAHLSTVMSVDANGEVSKLSKRHGSVSFEDMINEGYVAEAIINYIALLGWSPKQEREIFSLEELCEIFSLDGIVKSNPIFDYAKLSWMNGEYIKMMSDSDFEEYSRPVVEKLPLVIQNNWKFLASHIKSRISNRNEIEEKVRFFFDYSDFDLELFVNKKNKTTLENSKELLIKVLPILENLENWETDELNALLAKFAEDNGVKLGFVMWPVRIALSGQTVTPCGSGEILYVLGKEESIIRIKKSINRL